MSVLSLNKNALTKEQTDELLSSICSTILKRAQPLAIVVFGSAASYSMSCESDVDIAVLFSEPREVKNGLLKILKPGPLSSWPVDVLAYDLKRFKEKSIEGGVCTFICEEGKVLYPEGKSIEDL